MKNYFITIEGIEGVGKSTATEHLKGLLTASHIDFIATREPGGTEIAEKIRALLLNHHDEAMHIDTELLLFFAGRAQHYHQKIQPALAAGQWVLCDRFTDASYAYQCGGRGIPNERIKALEDWVLQGFSPDITLILHAPVEIALKRAKNRSELDRIEVEAAHFFERVQENYLQRAKACPKRYRLINAKVSPKQVKKQLNTVIEEIIELAKQDDDPS